MTFIIEPLTFQPLSEQMVRRTFAAVRTTWRFGRLLTALQLIIFAKNRTVLTFPTIRISFPLRLESRTSKGNIIIMTERLLYI